MPTITDNLNLFKPDPGQSGVAAELNGNWDQLDFRFDEAGGHTHDGTPGQGPKVPVTSLATTGTPSATTYLRGDGLWTTGTGGGGGVTDHGALTGLTDDDHSQYYNQSRGDGRYAQKANNLSDLSNTATARTNLGAAATVHQHAAADISTGTVATARLGSGTPSPTTFLRGDQTWAVPGAGGSVNLDDLADVLITSPADNQVLSYDAAGARWINEAAAAGVTNEDIDDRVNALIVAGTGITKTYDDTANTLTLAASGGGGSAVDPVSTLTLVDDFFTFLNTSGHISTLGWGLRVASNAAAKSAAAGHPGVIELSTGTTSGTNAMLMLDTNNVGMVSPADSLRVVWILKLLANDANTTARLGLGASSGNPPAAGLYFEKLDGDTSWYGVCRFGGTQTRTAALAATSTSWVKLTLRRVDASTIGFSVDGGTEATVTTNIPTGLLAPFAQIVNSAAANKAVELDFFSLTVSGLTR